MTVAELVPDAEFFEHLANRRNRLSNSRDAIKASHGEQVTFTTVLYH